jgi:hypothetical protein
VTAVLPARRASSHRPVWRASGGDRRRTRPLGRNPPGFVIGFKWHRGFHRVIPLHVIRDVRRCPPGRRPTRGSRNVGWPAAITAARVVRPSSSTISPRMRCQKWWVGHARSVEQSARFNKQSPNQSGPSTASTISSSVICSGGRASEMPPPTPRLARRMPRRANEFTIFAKYGLGTPAHRAMSAVCRQAHDSSLRQRKACTAYPVVCERQSISVASNSTRTRGTKVDTHANNRTDPEAASRTRSAAPVQKR